MSLPVVDLKGDAGEQGFAHGRALADRVAHNVEVYYDRFEREVSLSRAEAIERTGEYLRAIGDRAPDYEAGMRGLAEGSGLPYDDIAVLNLRYELLYYQYGTVKAAEAARKIAAQAAARELPKPDGCTSFALLPEATVSGRLLVGQNWDWIPQVKGALLRIREADGFGLLGFTEAGILGAKIGLNGAGVTLCINGMLTTADDWHRFTLPFHWRCHEILRARSFDAAVAVVADEPRACTTNFLVSQAPDRVVDLEAAPEKLGRIACDGGVLSHANHFENPEALGVEEPPSLGRPFSRHRARRLRELLAAGQPWTLPALKEALRDHDGLPNSVCRHGDESLPEIERVITVSAIVMDPEGGRLWATDGPPCESEFQEVALG